MINIIAWIIFGLIAGAIARFLKPGNDAAGWITTIIIGIVGSVVGGFLGRIFFGADVT
ncbi:UNVERIFIED_CONTAM: GlsB/YeaQ/YmgE family stress response membrane protein, partial [Bacillus mycoides]